MFINPTASDIILPTQIKIGGTQLSRVHVYEYLSVHIDDKLNMNNQIDVVCNKVQQKHGILKKMRKYITRETALCIYKTMIRPHFDYGDYMIDSGIQSKIDKIDKIQDKVVRTIEYKYNTKEREDIDILKKK